MSKYRITFSISLVIAVILIVLGGTLTIKGMTAKIRVSNCQLLDSLKMDNLSAGDYVSGSIESVLGQKSSFNNPDR